MKWVCEGLINFCWLLWGGFWMINIGCFGGFFLVELFEWDIELLVDIVDVFFVRILEEVKVKMFFFGVGGFCELCFGFEFFWNLV